jgi:hypothetical protein
MNGWNLLSMQIGQLTLDGDVDDGDVAVGSDKSCSGVLFYKSNRYKF